MAFDRQNGTNTTVAFSADTANFGGAAKDGTVLLLEPGLLHQPGTSHSKVPSPEDILPAVHAISPGCLLCFIARVRGRLWMSTLVELHSTAT